MALLGDEAAAERALEQVAVENRGAAACTLVTLMGLARAASASQSSRQPVRTVRLGQTDSASGARVQGPTEPHLARAALGRLKPTEREAVVLHVVGRLDAAQVAEACSVDLPTARQRLSRGLAQLIQERTRP
jgi:DNA-directed RNA polymerase specialized sigma24 family protein